MVMSMLTINRGVIMEEIKVQNKIKLLLNKKLLKLFGCQIK